MECSDLLLEQYHVRELPPEKSREVEAHLAGCSRCAGYLHQLAENDEAYLNRYPYTVVEKKITRAPARSWRELILGIPALLARPRLVPVYGLAALLLIAIPLYLKKSSENPGNILSAYRYKGTEKLDFISRADGVIKEREKDKHYTPGEELQFIYASTHYSHLALVSIEAGGAITFHTPAEAGGTATIAIEPGREAYYPYSIILDESTENELFVGIFSAGETSREEITTWLKGNYTSAQGQLAVLKKNLEKSPFRETTRAVALLVLKKK